MDTYKSSPAQTKKPAMRRKISKSVSNLRNTIKQQAPKDLTPRKMPGPAPRSGKIDSMSQSEEKENDEVFDLPSMGSFLNHPKSIGGQRALATQSKL